MALNERAITADDRNATAYLWRGQGWWALGYFDRAAADMDRCLAVDPAYANCTSWKAQVLISAGDDVQGLALFEEGIRLGFGNRMTSFIPALVRRGDTLAASVIVQTGYPPEISQALLQTLAMPNARRGDATALLKRHAVTGFYVGQMLMYLGDFDAAAALAIKNGSLDLPTVAWQPGQDTWRSSPAFKRVVSAIGAPSYWRQHGFPKQCRAVGGNDFHCD